MSIKIEKCGSNIIYITLKIFFLYKLEVIGRQKILHGI